ncbi:GntR family transcriptional regulator [Oceanicella sp. SM1341]|uniref:GntR family transcriptional regulator n=1 Tax=Oceanicella sp. SM1341 TaxID=1548889 RepID=UPI0018E52FE8|nr:GntR family transcriptional regulator [Oceanicella sp. SM1341]
MPPRHGPDRQILEESAIWPKHHQVYLVLRQQILDGTWGPEAPLPGEMALAAQFGVSRITIRKAMERLTQEGSVERLRGRGTFARRDPGVSPVGASLSGNFENLMALGLKTDVAVIEFGYLRAPADVCAAMQRPEGTVMQRVVRVRSLEGQPFSHLTTWLPEEIGRSFTREDMERISLLRLIERSGHRVQSARQTISARLATPDVARLLQIEPGEALISVNRTVSDAEGRPVERIFGLYRPDTYEHETSFERSADEATRVWNT